MAMIEHVVLGLGATGFHRMAYTQWGQPHNLQLAICVHGLTRNGRDFDTLAESLSDLWRVVCPDLVGRGQSDRLAYPLGYGLPQYMNDMTTLIARTRAEQVDWIGTSLGGLIGMLLAAMPGSPIRRLVLNDVGPFIPGASLDRIGAYVGTTPRFADIAAAESYLRQVHESFGQLTDDQWRHLTIHSIQKTTDGGYEMRYDPAIATPFKTGTPAADVDLWSTWDAIRCPVLVLRGEQSDLLTAATAAEMKGRGPACEVVEIAETGHAPMLMNDHQTGVIRTFLLG